MRVLPAILLFCACASERAAEISAPSFSTPSESFQTSYVSRGPSSVQRVQVNADLVVRPDTLCVPIWIYAAADQNGAAMTLVEDAATKLRAAAGEGVTLRIDDIDAHSDRTKVGARTSVSMRGVIETDLPEADAWIRAKKVAALHRVLVEQVTLEASKRDDDGPPAVHVVVGQPEPGLRDVEAHRGKLLAGWAERTKALAGIATAEGGALELLSCTPPAQVVVVGGTLEKIGLTLPVSCTFEVRRTK